MKNTRKKLLVSSVAALLVSAMALSTATFAWFTTSTTATTEGLKVHTSQASELLISSATSGWDTHIDYATGDKLLLPASTVNGSNWWTADAIIKTNYAAANKYVTASGSNYYYANQLNVMNNAAEGGASVKNVQIKMTWPSNCDTSYLRVALVEAEGKGTDKGFATGAAFTDCIVAKDNTAYYPVKADGTVDTTVTTETVEGKKVVTVTPKENAVTITPKAGPTSSGAVVTIDGELAPQEAKYYNLYVWFEGQDTDCFDTNAGAAIPDIVFEVTGDTAESN